MKQSLLSIAAASMLVASVGVAAAQPENPARPAWTPAQGQSLITTWHTMHYTSFDDPSLHPQVGTVLPETVHLYPLPDTMRDPSYTSYRYVVINDHPVVVESTTRKVVHTWN